MSELVTISIDQDVVTAAANRARQQGLTTEDYVMQVLMRDMERDPSEKTILAYDAAHLDAPFILDREDGESDEHFENRSSTLRKLFP